MCKICTIFLWRINNNLGGSTFVRTQRTEICYDLPLSAVRINFRHSWSLDFLVTCRVIIDVYLPRDPSFIKLKL